MRSYRFFIVLLALLAIGFALYFGLRNMQEPLVTVNSQTIFREDFNRSYQATYSYYYAAARTYGDASKFGSKDDVDALKKATLEQLIANALVHEEVARMFGSEAEAMVEKKVDAVVKDQDFERAASAIYGLTFAEFKSRFLVPLAEMELLDGKLVVEKNSAEEWLAKAKKEAKVTFLDSAFGWGENGVELRD
jgi:hypothetical protein